MRSSWWRAAVLAAACGLPSCAPGNLDGFAPSFNGTITGPTDATGCAQEPESEWRIDGSPSAGVEVGSVFEIKVTPPFFASACSGFITAVEWKSTIPGIVSFEPGNVVFRALLTAAAPGETHILAEVSLERGSVKTVRPHGDQVVVVFAEPGQTM
jgi:hypothetical protein